MPGQPIEGAVPAQFTGRRPCGRRPTATPVDAPPAPGPDAGMTIPAEIAEIVGEIDFDPEALHARYLAERDKRLREDGAGQYVEVKAEFSHYVDDPYVEPGFTRAP